MHLLWLLLWLSMYKCSRSQQCRDVGGSLFCQDVLRRNGGSCDGMRSEELAQCRKTCGCKNAGPPPWALQTRRRPIVTEAPRNNDNAETALPLYAVIIIAVALLTIFIGITVCILKIKQKWKKRKLRKISKNRNLLRYAPPPMETLPPNYIWATGSNNDAYCSDAADVWPGMKRNKAAILNNSNVRGHHAGEKNINVVKNETTKRPAPNPMEDTKNQNPKVHNPEDRTISRGKGPAPLPPVQNSATTKPTSTGVDSRAIEAIPIQRSDSPFSDITDREDVREKVVQRSAMPQMSKSQDRDDPEVSTRKRTNDKGYQSDDTITQQSECAYSAVTDDTMSAPALVSILGEWKDHLQTQRKELADYHKNLHAYIQRIGLKPRSDIYEDLVDPEYDSAQRKSLKNVTEAEFSQVGLEEAILDLREKMTRIQNQLGNSQQHREIITQGLRIDTPIQEFKSSARSRINTLTESRFTIKTLLQQLGERDCLKLQVRIAEVLDVAQKRERMAVSPRDGPITCHCKQIYNTMNDMLDPRTSTKVELATHAASTLSTKLVTGVQCNLLPVLHNDDVKINVSKTTERIATLVQKLLQMTKQLASRMESCRESDFSIFIQTLIDGSERIMDATFHLVCTIVDLQTEEKRGLYRSMPLSLPLERDSRIQLPPRQQTFDNRGKPERLNQTGSYCTSLSSLDVRRLNEDLARLRRLLEPGHNLPALSDVTLTNNERPYTLPGTTQPIKRTTTDTKDWDGMSSISCSTCMFTDADESQFFEDDLTDLMYPDGNSVVHTPTPGDMGEDGDAHFDDDGLNGPFRPATRPQKNKPNCFANTIYNGPNELKLPHVDQQSTQAESSKQSNTRGLQPSSFASFHSGNIPTSEVQPRHQAMLGRYFGGEVIEAKPTENNTKDSNQSQVDHTRETAEKNAPQAKMLPCGLVATDTPNEPTKKPDTSALLDIPTITVYRNGAKEDFAGEKHTPSDEVTSPDTPRNNDQRNTPDVADDNDEKQSLEEAPVPIETPDADDNESSDDDASIKSAENLLDNYPDDSIGETEENQINNSDGVIAFSPDKPDKIMEQDESADVPAESPHMEVDAGQEGLSVPNQTGGDSQSLASEFEFPRAPSATEQNLDDFNNSIDHDGAKDLDEQPKLPDV